MKKRVLIKLLALLKTLGGRIKLLAQPTGKTREFLNKMSISSKKDLLTNIVRKKLWGFSYKNFLGLVFIFFFSGSSMGSEKALSELQIFFKNRQINYSYDNPGVTPSSSATLIKAIQNFLSEGGNPNTVLNPSTGKTLLHLSSYYRHKAAVKLLLENQADINILDKKNRTPLCSAILGEALDTAFLLLEKGADPLGKCWAFHLAMTKKTLPLAKAMLTKVNINEPDNEGWTALHWAAYYQEPDVVKWLLENGTDVSAKNNRGETALYVIVDLEDDDDETLAIIDELLEAGASPHAKNNLGETPLEIALEFREKSKIVKLLKPFLRENEENAPDEKQILERTLKHYVARICKRDKQRSIWERTKDSFRRYRTSCDVAKNVAELTRGEYYWLKKARRLGFDIKYDLYKERGVVTLNSSHSLLLSLERWWMDCLLFTCWKNGVVIDIAGKWIRFLNCEGKDESSECHKRLEQWKERLRSGESLKVYFVREPRVTIPPLVDFDYFITKMEWL